MSILRTIAMFVYLFGYMIVHYGVLRRAERLLAAGDTEAVRAIGYTGLTEVDGGVSLGNLPLLHECGLDAAVMGTALFKSANPAEDIAKIHQMR